MCLITKMTEPTIATEDITCYKVIRKCMLSLYYNGFKWEFGKIHTSQIKVVERPDNAHEIYQGLHSYATLKGLKKAYYTATVPCLAVKCTIPSGSKVYSGRHNNLKGYASDQLIVNEVKDTKELYSDFDWNNYPYKEGQVIQIHLFDYKIWEDYQIMNIQPHPTNNTRVNLIVKDCRGKYFEHTIKTTFDGKVWQSEIYDILNKSKEG